MTLYTRICCRRTRSISAPGGPPLSSTSLLLSIDGTDGQTDGRAGRRTGRHPTVTQTLLRTMWTASINEYYRHSRLMWCSKYAFFPENRRHSPRMGLHGGDEHVCLYAYLSACISVQPNVRSLSNFLCMLPTLVARSFFSGVAICYVLPVLQMTSCLHIMAWNRRCEKAYSQSDSPGGSTDLTP